FAQAFILKALRPALDQSAHAGAGSRRSRGQGTRWGGCATDRDTNFTNRNLRQSPQFVHNAKALVAESVRPHRRICLDRQALGTIKDRPTVPGEWCGSRLRPGSDDSPELMAVALFGCDIERVTQVQGRQACKD